MRYEVELIDEAVADYKALKASTRSTIKEAMEVHLRNDPEQVSRSRIKPLRELSKPQYRLRVGEFRVFYDVADGTVTVHAIVLKSEAASWLARLGKDE